MRKALYLLSDKDRNEFRQILLVERGHISPELEAAWRKALKQAEEEGISPEEISSGQVDLWYKAMKWTEKELGLTK